MTPSGAAIGGSQLVFNVVGRVHQPHRTAALAYSLNGGPERPVYFQRKHSRWGRLERTGDFNIDTITQDQLRRHNTLTLKLIDRTRRETQHTIRFDHELFASPERRFRLDLQNTDSPEQAGQIIDGCWRIEKDEHGVRCLRVRAENAGYDRLITFGSHDWTTGYEVTARLCVTEWTNLRYQNVGLLFKWNPHARGDGRHLPREWSTGLAYYAAMCPGLRLRFGVNVHLDKAGRKRGCHVLAERPYSAWRRLVGFVKNEALRLGKRPITQLRTRVMYQFRLHVHPERYALTVWPADEPEPAPQLEMLNPPDLLPTGSVGIIAAYSAVNVYDFETVPLPLEADRPKLKRVAVTGAAPQFVEV